MQTKVINASNKEENQHNRSRFQVGRHYTFDYTGQERQTLKLQNKLSFQAHRLTFLA